MSDHGSSLKDLAGLALMGAWNKIRKHWIISSVVAVLAVIGLALLFGDAPGIAPAT